MVLYSIVHQKLGGQLPTLPTQILHPCVATKCVGYTCDVVEDENWTEARPRHSRKKNSGKRSSKHNFARGILDEVAHVCRVTRQAGNSSSYYVTIAHHGWN